MGAVIHFLYLKYFRFNVVSYSSLVAEDCSDIHFQKGSLMNELNYDKSVSW